MSCFLDLGLGGGHRMDPGFFSTALGFPGVGVKVELGVRVFRSTVSESAPSTPEEELVNGSRGGGCRYPSTLASPIHL